ncbi:MAG: glycosyltransferase family 2 protein [Flavobacterium micromati]|nr:glycosyltransferase family 2 protein [Flavobacterium micromati]
MPLFSVIIPLYNKENFIQNTLQSVLDQSFVDFEIIIVNDGSTDKSEEIVLAFNDPRITYFSKLNEGVSAARNYGIQQSKGIYVAFLDGDDLWFPQHLATLHALIVKNPRAGIFAARYQLIFQNQSIYIPKFRTISENYSGIIPDYFESSLQYAVATSSSIAIPKAVFNNVGYFDTEINVGEDTDMWTRIALQYSVAITNEVTVSYLHYVQNSLSKQSILNKKIKDFTFYKEAEKQNSSLKKYQDLYRLEYALQYKMANKHQIANLLYAEIEPKSIRLKNKILFFTPKIILILLKKFKIFLRNNGVEFSIYH